ncbi:MAG: thioredoxin domain-containing protein, partial [Blastocatellia bacterium]|nr:thioredoxin domain-containing protein [Blastocatellia bacterium]
QVYIRAYQLTKKDLYKRVTEETLDWVLTEMTHQLGGFYSTLDADSEGEEGKFYVWQQNEIEELLGSDAEAFIHYYGVTEEGNFEGKNILFVEEPISRMLSEVAKEQKMTEEDVWELLKRSRKVLLAERNKRVRPGLDDKILTAWNGMMIRSFAEAGRILNRNDYTNAAIKAASFLLTTNREGQKLLRSYKDGKARFNAYLEDYSYLIDGLIALYEATFDLNWLKEARSLAKVMIEQFWDNQEAGFFFTGSDHEELIARSKDFSDNATPSGNSVAVDALLRLHMLFNQEEYESKAVMILHMVSKPLERFSTGFGHMLCALDFYLSRPKEVAIIGNRDSQDTKLLLDTVSSNYFPNLVLVFAEPNDEEAKQLIPLLADRSMVGGKATAYVCERFACKQPVTSAEELLEQLR